MIDYSGKEGSRSLVTLELSFAQKVLNVLARNPSTFNQKIMYKMAYDRRPILTTFADKLKVREYVSSTIGSGYLTKLYLSGTDPEEINFKELPSDFVLKVNHGSGGVVLVWSGSDSNETLPKHLGKRETWGKYEIHPQSLDNQALVNITSKWLGQDYYFFGGCRRFPEWAYKNIERKYLIEELLTEEDGNLPPDYRFYVFGGECAFIKTSKKKSRRDHSSQNEIMLNFFTTEWEQIDLRQDHYQRSSEVLPKPQRLSEMIEISERLSGGIDFLRVDLYQPNPGRIVVGELTNYPDGGTAKFKPNEWDKHFGEMLKLDKHKYSYPE